MCVRERDTSRETDNTITKSFFLPEADDTNDRNMKQQNDNHRKPRHADVRRC